jgi:ribosomal protein S2
MAPRPHLALERRGRGYGGPQATSHRSRDAQQFAAMVSPSAAGREKQALMTLPTTRAGERDVAAVCRRTRLCWARRRPTGGLLTDYARIADLVNTYEHLPLGVTDASDIAIAEPLGLTEGRR